MKVNRKITLLFLLGSLLVLAGCSNGTQTQSIPNDNSVASSSPIKERNVVVQAKAWDFQVNNGDSQALDEIRVKKGEKINLKGQSLDMGHGIGIPDYGVNIKFDPANEAETSFIADKEGVFDFICTVHCGQGHRDHKGKLIVEN